MRIIGIKRRLIFKELRHWPFDVLKNISQGKEVTFSATLAIRVHLHATGGGLQLIETEFSVGHVVVWSGGGRPP